MKSCLPKLLLLVFAAVSAGVGWTVFQRLQEEDGPRRGGNGPRAVPVETSPVVIGPIEEKRTFSGTLEPSAETTVAARVSGRVLNVSHELADPVQRGEVIVELDPAEYKQAVARAEAELLVARARVSEFENRLAIAGRGLDRTKKLTTRGINSDSDLDNAQAEYLVRSSAVEVAKAERTAAEAALETTQIRLADTRVQATWTGGDAERIVAHRSVEEGDTISPNQALFRVVELNPVRAVFFVPERDYARLQKGQRVELTTDAWPDRVFPAEIHRIAPVFQEQSRQARVEILAKNDGYPLKPGMFIRATVSLEQHENARIVPASAITRRGQSTGIFLIDEATQTARWLEVRPGIQDGDKIEVVGDAIEGKVVRLGQQLLQDGSSVLLPDAPDTDAPDPAP